MRSAVAKRTLDVLVAVSLLVLLALPMVLIALAIRLAMGGPVIFRQVRPGKNGRLFELYKFRTMTEARGEDGRLLHDGRRLTRLGRLLRRTSLDELPQLWNVLKGEMSLVGPRPLLVEYLPRYTPGQARRHQVCPGIAGLAQVMGRNAIPFSRRLAYDAWYVDHFSLWLDLKILALTLLKLSTGVLYDGAGQDVRVVDNIGLHPGEEAAHDLRCGKEKQAA